MRAGEVPHPDAELVIPHSSYSPGSPPISSCTVAQKKVPDKGFSLPGPLLMKKIKKSSIQRVHRAQSVGGILRLHERLHLLFLLLFLYDPVDGDVEVFPVFVE
jgi:hypothetical protein